MASSRYYIDSSALVKLMLPEPQSSALEAALEPEDRFQSSDLLKVEASRAVRRAGGQIRGRPQQWLDRVALIAITPSIRDRACEIGRPFLRALDAIHLATMDEAREGIDGLISYDERLIDAACALGFRVLSPR